MQKNPRWVRIYDVDSDELDVKFHELPQRAQSLWDKHNPLDTEGSWLEFGNTANCYGPTLWDGTELS
ncbi:hypothetical protein [Marinomonas sp. 2405UD68-3]|uniref:hypothetical protein n=1 Tax=Marinomonas sp. 2405UD68-3 TaxID=3391835 RepID=UPI0039C9958D